MAKFQREFILFSILGIAVLIVLLTFGQAYTLRMLMEASCYAILALGLTIQWGYAGLFNARSDGIHCSRRVRNDADVFSDQ